jgi:hypothetical protein
MPLKTLHLFEVQQNDDGIKKHVWLNDQYIYSELGYGAMQPVSSVKRCAPVKNSRDRSTMICSGMTFKNLNQSEVFKTT